MEKYVGRNEKTKIVVKITKVGLIKNFVNSEQMRFFQMNGHAPVREPPVNEEARKKMMAFWYKRQEKDKVFCFFF